MRFLIFIVVIFGLLGGAIWLSDAQADNRVIACVEVGGTPITVQHWFTTEYVGCVIP